MATEKDWILRNSMKETKNNGVGKDTIGGVQPEFLRVQRAQTNTYHA